MRSYRAGLESGSIDHNTEKLLQPLGRKRVADTLPGADSSVLGDIG